MQKSYVTIPFVGPQIIIRTGLSATNLITKISQTRQKSNPILNAGQRATLKSSVAIAPPPVKSETEQNTTSGSLKNVSEDLDQANWSLPCPPDWVSTS